MIFFSHWKPLGTQYSSHSHAHLIWNWVSHNNNKISQSMEIHSNNLFSLQRLSRFTIFSFLTVLHVHTDMKTKMYHPYRDVYPPIQTTHLSHIHQLFLNCCFLPIHKIIPTVLHINTYGYIRSYNIFTWFFIFWFILYFLFFLVFLKRFFNLNVFLSTHTVSTFKEYSAHIPLSSYLYVYVYLIYFPFYLTMCTYHPTYTYPYIKEDLTLENFHLESFNKNILETRAIVFFKIFNLKMNSWFTALIDDATRTTRGLITCAKLQPGFIWFRLYSILFLDNSFF